MRLFRNRTVGWWPLQGAGKLIPCLGTATPQVALVTQNRYVCITSKLRLQDKKQIQPGNTLRAGISVILRPVVKSSRIVCASRHLVPLLITHP